MASLRQTPMPKRGNRHLHAPGAARASTLTGHFGAERRVFDNIYAKLGPTNCVFLLKSWVGVLDASLMRRMAGYFSG